MQELLVSALARADALTKLLIENCLAPRCPLAARLWNPGGSCFIFDVSPLRLLDQQVQIGASGTVIGDGHTDAEPTVQHGV